MGGAFFRGEVPPVTDDRLTLFGGSEVWVVDLDGDGVPDIHTRPPHDNNHFTFWGRRSIGKFELMKQPEAGELVSVTENSERWSVALSDFDLDGNLDAFITTGEYILLHTYY